MSTPNPLKAALRRGDRQLGLWLSLMSPTAAEMLSRRGFDWLLIDMEHSALEAADVLTNLRAMTGGAAEPVVRVPWNDFVVIKRVLDLGARSLLVPYVQNAEEARRAVAATRYPPDGIRGFAGMTRANDYAADTAYATTAADQIFLAVQLESPEALANAGAIAEVEGVDALFVGPNDLAANMGRLGEAASEPVQRAIDSVLAPIRERGKAAGVLEFDPERAARRLDQGFRFVAIGSDMGLLKAAAERLAGGFRPK